METISGSVHRLGKHCDGRATDVVEMKIIDLTRTELVTRLLFARPTWGFGTVQLGNWAQIGALSVGRLRVSVAAGKGLSAGHYD
jgi:hypothetical protein